mgnify:CR=1 FL=1
MRLVASLVGANHKHAGLCGVGKNGCICEPHDRRAVDDNEIENLKPDGQQRHETRTCQEIGSVWRKGTGCHEWLFIAHGVEWSPVTTSTSGSRASWSGSVEGGGFIDPAYGGAAGWESCVTTITSSASPLSHLRGTVASTGAWDPTGGSASYSGLLTWVTGKKN